MPIQAPQWTEFLSCPVCCNEFAANLRPPISLGCGHTICRTCLATLHRKQCPFDQTIITTELDNLPVNNALLQLVSTSNTAGSSPGSSGTTTSGSSLGSSSTGGGNGGSPGGTSSSGGSSGAPDPDLSSPSVQNLPPDDLQCYKTARGCIEELALYLKPYPNGNAGGLLSRPMQRKLVTLVNCQLIEDEGRARSLRAARSLGERTVTELILQHQNPQQLSTNLWAAVRARGCQFLGPAMQEEVLKLVLLALEDGSALSRKVLVMFVVQRLEPHFPQASKTSIGHVVQLLYRASCFKVSKREGDSSLMQLKEEFRTYEALRREHDAQIVQIATEAGLRIAPDQWSSLLYGDTAHKSHMQSIIDKLQTPQSFVQSVQELIIALQRTGDPANLSGLRMHLKHLAGIDSNAENHVPTWRECSTALESVKRVVIGLVEFVQHHGNRKLQEPGHLTHNSKYKISLCRDLNLRGTCPRGPNCTFAHSEEELEKYRTKLRTKGIRTPNGKDHGGGGGEYMGDLGMPSGSHGYPSSGEEASPMRYPKSTPPIRYLDKSPMSSHSHASGSSNSNSSHNSHLAPIPPPHQHPSYPNVPPQPSPLQQHGANGRSFNFNPNNYPSGGGGGGGGNMSYGARPPPPSMQPPPPPPSVRGNFIRPPNGNYLGHPPPPPSMQHNPGNAPPPPPPPMNHPSYSGVGQGGQPPPPPLDQMHPGQMMNAPPPPPYVGNQGYSEYSDKLDQHRRQFNPWENQPPPPTAVPPSNPNGAPPQHLNMIPPPGNMMGGGGPSKSAGMNPSYPPSMKQHMQPSSMGSHSLPPLPNAAQQQPHHPHHQQQQQQLPPVHTGSGNGGKFFPGNGPLHHQQHHHNHQRPRGDYRDKHHNNNNGRMHPSHGHPQQQVPPMHHHQPPASFGNGGTRSNLHTPLPQQQTPSSAVTSSSNGGTGSNGGMMNGYHGGTGGTLSFNRSEALELYKMITAAASNAPDLANLVAGATKDMFVRSDSLLAADDDLMMSENEYANATGSSGTGGKFGPISRMNNAIGGKQQRDFPFASGTSNLMDSDWLLSMQHQLYNDVAGGGGEQSSSNCSSTSSSFYQLSQQQQQQQHPVVSSSSQVAKHEPNNNTLELDLFHQVDRKLSDYNGGDNSANATSQLLHHHQVEAQLLLQQQQQQQQQQHHHSISAAVASSALMSSHQQVASAGHSHHSSPQPHHHHHQHHPSQHGSFAQQQQQQQNSALQQQQHMQKLQSQLADAMRFGDLMGNGGGGGGAGTELKLHVLKDLKAQQTLTGLSPVSGVLPGASSGVSSSSVRPLWNSINLMELSGLKPDSSGGGGSDLLLNSNSSGSNGGLNTTTTSAGSNNNLSTASSSIGNLHNNNNNSEDSYEAGIADGMRELELRLESDLGLDENGA